MSAPNRMQIEIRQNPLNPGTVTNSTSTLAPETTTSTTAAPTGVNTTTSTTSSSIVPTTALNTTSSTIPPTTLTTPKTTSTTAQTTVVITPTTIIVIGTQTFTSQLAPTTLTTASLGNNNSNSNGGLSSGARGGIIAGSVVGGLALFALFLFLCLSARRKRRNNLDAKENIRWPEIVATAEDRAALYPEQTHPTGRSGLGGEDDEMEEVARAGAITAGAAGVGAYAGAGRFNSTTSRQPTLPAIPASMYGNESMLDSGYAGGSSNNGGLSHSNSRPTFNAPSSYTTYPDGPATNSTQSHTPLAGGISSMDYNRSSPSPPRQADGSSGDHGTRGSASSPLPYPGSSDADHDEGMGRPSSPTPMHVGAFGPGYQEDGKWRLSVVNDDQ